MDEMSMKAIASKNNERQFEELVNSTKQWILRTAADASRHYVSESDDEWSIALSAFHEAVQHYNEEKGSFLSLASVVIKRRIVDHIRSQGRYSSEIAVLPDAFEGRLDEDTASGINLKVQEQITRTSMENSTGQTERTREEIAELQEILNGYGFSFFDLAECSPKAVKTKKSCCHAIRTLIASAVLMALMRLKHLLPIRKLSEASGVIRKILERHRKYIIASAEILVGDFPILGEYLRSVREEECNESCNT
ncbi:MAG: hypothetical protein J6N15_03480 [Ruminiclostridium sp.]|nr:hypothetical protein [Ruminiclostridium sp.]